MPRTAPLRLPYGPGARWPRVLAYRPAARRGPGLPQDRRFAGCRRRSTRRKADPIARHGYPRPLAWHHRHCRRGRERGSRRRDVRTGAGWRHRAGGEVREARVPTLTTVPYNSTIIMKRKHTKTLAAIFARPTSGSIPWPDIEALFKALGADIEEREGSRIAVVLFGEVRVFHRPHPSTDTDKGAVASIRKWLAENGEAP